jgi:hypothetical protein
MRLQVVRNPVGGAVPIANDLLGLPHQLSVINSGESQGLDYLLEVAGALTGLARARALSIIIVIASLDEGHFAEFFSAGRSLGSFAKERPEKAGEIQSTSDYTATKRTVVR